MHNDVQHNNCDSEFMDMMESVRMTTNWTTRRNRKEAVTYY